MTQDTPHETPHDSPYSTPEAELNDGDILLSLRRSRLTSTVFLFLSVLCVGYVMITPWLSFLLVIAGIVCALGVGLFVAGILGFTDMPIAKIKRNAVHNGLLHRSVDFNTLYLHHGTLRGLVNGRDKQILRASQFRWSDWGQLNALLDARDAEHEQ